MLNYAFIVLALLMPFALTGCQETGTPVTPQAPTGTPVIQQAAVSAAVTQQAAIDAAWQDLNPITASHNRANFEPIESRRVSGNEIADRFKDTKTNSYCWGQKIPANVPVSPST